MVKIDKLCRGVFGIENGPRKTVYTRCGEKQMTGRRLRKLVNSAQSDFAKEDTHSFKFSYSLLCNIFLRAQSHTFVFHVRLLNLR